MGFLGFEPHGRKTCIITGVDIMDCVTLKYKDGSVAQLMMSAEVALGQNVSVFGTKGQLEVSNRGSCGRHVTTPHIVF